MTDQPHDARVAVLAFVDGVLVPEGEATGSPEIFVRYIDFKVAADERDGLRHREGFRKRWTVHTKHPWDGLFDIKADEMTVNAAGHLLFYHNSILTDAFGPGFWIHCVEEKAEARDIELVQLVLYECETVDSCNYDYLITRADGPRCLKAAEIGCELGYLTDLGDGKYKKEPTP